MPKNTNDDDRNIKLHLKDVRLSFPHIWTPKAAEAGGEPRYSCNLLMEKGSEQHKVVTRAIRQLAATHLGGKVPADNKRPLHDGAEKEYDGYEGHVYLTANAKAAARLLLVDERRNDLREEDGKLYAGCYCNALVTLWYQTHKVGGKRINCQLRGLQFLRHGEAFAGGGTASRDEFEEEDYAEAEDMEEADSELGEDDDDLI